MKRTQTSRDDEAPPRRSRKTNHHSEQYGKAAGRAVEAALGMLVDDEALSGLHVQEARLEGAVLEVLLEAPPMSWDALVALEQHVQSYAPWLRAALAADMQRKRTPHLRLRVVPASEPS
jgi:hypothetical protein